MKGLQRQKQLGEEGTKKQEDKSEQQAEDVAAFLAGKGGVATGVVAMDTTPPLNPPSSADVSSSGVSEQSDTAPPQQGGQDSQTSQTSFQEPVQPVGPVQPPPLSSGSTPGEQEQWQWPQTPPDQPQSLRLTATNPELAHVLPPGPVVTGTGANSAESANSSSASMMVGPSAPPPTYDQVAGQGTTTAYDGVNMQPQSMVGGYDPAYQQAQAPSPAAGSYFPPPGPYDYQYGAPPPPVGGGVTPTGVPSYGQQFSSPAPSQSYASTANWGSFDTGSGSSDLPSQHEPSVPYVDRSTKPPSLSALNTGWGGKSIRKNYSIHVYLVMISAYLSLFKKDIPEMRAPYIHV